jgi:phosphatidylinositol alpha-mannosyltransferase
MKIALVSPYDYVYPGGVTEHITRLERSFTKMGHSVKIIAPASLPQESFDISKVYVVGRPFSIPSSGSVARISLSPRLSGRVKQILRQEQFDVIHLHEPLIPALPITVLRFSTSINVGTFHAYHGRRSRGYRYMKILLRRWFRKLHGRIAVSRPAMQFVSRDFPGHYEIIPNGVDVESFSEDVTPFEQYRDGKLNILFCGRIEKRKGLEYLLRAYSVIKGQFPDSRLIVVGEGKLREGYGEVVRSAFLRDVIFTGYVSDEEKIRYFKTADIFCSPATGKESFGIVLLEAMAAGKPIIASNIEGYASVMAHGVEGLLSTPCDVESLSMSLSYLMGNKRLRERMGAMGRRKAEEYSWERISRRVMEYYESLLRGSPAGAGLSKLVD